ncbi:MAG: wax ester/triacylglycerol synthase family O-acyltransferase [Byssovorax sp.]
MKPGASGEMLGALQATFLALEEEGLLMHLGVLLVFAGEPDAAPILSALWARLPAIPRFRRRLCRAPLLGQPAFVDDPAIDRAAHLRVAHVPPPGDEAALQATVADLYAERLPRDRPLWQVTFLDGLSAAIGEGDPRAAGRPGRFALFFKIHHAMLNGAEGLAALDLLLQPSPDAIAEALAWPAPRPPPRAAALLGMELARRIEGARALAAWVTRPAALARGFLDMIDTAIHPASPTPLNPPRLGPRRAVTWTSVPLAAVRARRDGGTVNDVLLAALAGGMRGYLAEKGLDVDHLRARAAVPVAVRRADGSAEVAALIAPFPIAPRTPEARLRAAVDTMVALKRSRQVDAMDLAERLADLTSHRLLARGLLAASRRRPCTVTTSNLAGPKEARYLGGARLLGIHPLLTLTDTQGLGASFVSCDGVVTCSLIADAAAVPDLSTLRDAITEAFAALPAG